MRELKRTETKAVCGGQQNSSNPPPGAPGNGADAVEHGVAVFGATRSITKAVGAAFVRFVT